MADRNCCVADGMVECKIESGKCVMNGRVMYGWWNGVSGWIAGECRLISVSPVEWSAYLMEKGFWGSGVCVPDGKGFLEVWCVCT